MAIQPYKGVKQRISCDIECHKEREFTRQLSMTPLISGKASTFL